MLLFELLFFLVIAIYLGLALFNFPNSRFKRKYLLFLAAGVFVVGALFQDVRWQMIPACLVFFLLVVAVFWRIHACLILRILAIVPLVLLLLLSASLAQLMPIVNLPAPQGPYPVGTFTRSVTDPSRVEPFEPDRSRELFLQAWYPGDINSTSSYPVQTLWQELYSGGYDIVTFFSGYLEKMQTHSHVEAPVASAGPFPLLVYNHGYATFTSQNTFLMEHLASHGYVILAIGRPFDGLKVNLQNAGKEIFTMRIPPSAGVQQGDLPTIPWGQLTVPPGDGDAASAHNEIANRLGDRFRAMPEESARRQFIAEVMENTELYGIPPEMTEEYLYNEFLMGELVGIPWVERWLRDVEFLVDHVEEIEYPIEGFLSIVDADKLGVFGMSFGGGIAGEFCKIDPRCKAGANLDGSQNGVHWDQPVGAPFMMIYIASSWRGSNNFAYLPPSEDFWDVKIADALHADLTDAPVFLPILDFLGFSGSISGTRVMEILNTIQLTFFDHYLKQKPLPDLGEEFAELDIRMIPSGR